MRFAWIGLGMSVGVVLVSLGACSSPTDTPRLGLGGSGGDDGSGNGNVTSTGSGQVCGTLVGPSIPAKCTICPATTTTGSGIGGAGNGGAFTSETSSQGSGGLVCQPNGCVQGLWCDTSTNTCEMPPVCNSTTATSGVGGAGSTSTGPTAGTGAATTGTGTTGVGGASTSTGGGVCVPKCLADADCQSSCPPVGNGDNCCDLATNVCYVTNMACPMPNPATTGVGGGSMY